MLLVVACKMSAVWFRVSCLHKLGALSWDVCSVPLVTSLTSWVRYRNRTIGASESVSHILPPVADTLCLLDRGLYLRMCAMCSSLLPSMSLSLVPHGSYIQAMDLSAAVTEVYVLVCCSPNALASIAFYWHTGG